MNLRGEIPFFRGKTKELRGEIHIFRREKVFSSLRNPHSESFVESFFKDGAPSNRAKTLNFPSRKPLFPRENWSKSPVSRVKNHLLADQKTVFCRHFLSKAPLLWSIFPLKLSFGLMTSHFEPIYRPWVRFIVSLKCLKRKSVEKSRRNTLARAHLLRPKLPRKAGRVSLANWTLTISKLPNRRKLTIAIAPSRNLAPLIILTKINDRPGPFSSRTSKSL